VRISVLAAPFLLHASRSVGILLAKGWKAREGEPIMETAGDWCPPKQEASNTMEATLEIREDEADTLALKGEFVVETAQAVRTWAKTKLAQGVLVLALDLRGVTRCDPTGVGTMLGIYKRVMDVDGNFHIKIAPGQSIRELLGRLDVETIIPTVVGAP
jgi:ABC-type transporter Mla MlaB component